MALAIYLILFVIPLYCYFIFFFIPSPLGRQGGGLFSFYLTTTFFPFLI